MTGDRLPTLPSSLARRSTVHRTEAGLVSCRVGEMYSGDNQRVKGFAAYVKATDFNL